MVALMLSGTTATWHPSQVVYYADTPMTSTLLQLKAHVCGCSDVTELHVKRNTTLYNVTVGRQITELLLNIDSKGLT